MARHKMKSKLMRRSGSGRYGHSKKKGGAATGHKAKRGY
ncbi:hypothetical protein LCGC14_2139040 [marine sediment metagenome]|uniref:Uncharacterized protein n=1 Tax=marine sediment metagenome TaxID=412755 RepID=A0A0F9DZ64_9ZZZZ